MLPALRRLARASSLACRADCPLGARLRGEAGEQGCVAEQFRAFVEIANLDLVLYRPGARAVSFDEHWLLRLAEALRKDDRASARALIAFRVEKIRRRTALAAGSAILARIPALDATDPCAK